MRAERDRADAVERGRAREREVCEVRDVLAQTVEVKIEYEEVIRELLEDERVRDVVLEICLKNR